MSEDSEPAETASLGDLSDLADGEMRAFEDIGDYGVVVCRVDGELYAIEDNCSHADTPLSEGRLRGVMVMCPLHGAGFDVRDGSHSGPPAYEGVRCHRVHVDDDGTVAVAIAASSAGGNSLNDDVGARFRTR